MATAHYKLLVKFSCAGDKSIDPLDACIAIQETLKKFKEVNPYSLEITNAYLEKPKVKKCNCGEMKNEV